MSPHACRCAPALPPPRGFSRLGAARRRLRMTFVYKADPKRAAVWAQQFERHAPQLPFRIWPDVGDAKQVRFLAAWLPPDDLAATFPNLEVLFSVGAGVDQLNLAQI